MSNNEVFNTSGNPIFTQMTNTYQSPGIISPPESNASLAGSLYNVNLSNSALVVLGLTSATISLMITNPVGSGKMIYVSRVMGSVGGSSLLSSLSGSAVLVKSGTLTAPSTLTPSNNNFSSTNVSVVTAKSSVSTVSGGTTLLSFQLAPGPFSQDYTGRIIVPPGNSLAVSVTASSSTAGLTITSAANITWWEA